MGFFKKLANFIRGKGFKETEIVKNTGMEALRKAEILDRQPIQPEPIQKEEVQRTNTDLQKDFEIKRPVPFKETQELREISERFERSGNINEIQERMDNSTISKVSFKPSRNLNDLNNVYNTLLKRSTFSTVLKDGTQDKALIDILIQNREKLRHRFSAEIEIGTDKGTAFVSIDGILAENLNDINDFIQIGGTYTSQELSNAINIAIAHFEKQYGAIGGSVKTPTASKVIVQDISFQITFA